MDSSANFSAFARFPHWFSGQIQGPWNKAKADAERISKASISLPFSDGLMLSQLVFMSGGRKWVELGTLTGFSAICIVNGWRHPDSQLWTVERDPNCAQISRENLNFDSRVEVCEGDAKSWLTKLAVLGPFDGVFFDATKSEYEDYFQWALVNLNRGGTIIADNVFLGERPAFLGRGSRLNHEKTDKNRWSVQSKQKMSQLLDLAFDSTKFRSCLIPSSDGFLVSVKLN